MRSEIVQRLHKNFEDYVHERDGVEFWFARDTTSLDIRNGEISSKLSKKPESCKNSNHPILDHFVDVNKSIPVQKEASGRSMISCSLDIPCYLIAQNGNPRKEEIAFCPELFRSQTRKQEIIEEQIRLGERLQAWKQLRDSETEHTPGLFMNAVWIASFANIRSKGDKALFGGFTTKKGYENAS